MVKIYTKTGDTGETSLYGGRRVPKFDLHLEALGQVDEANAALGLAFTQLGAEMYWTELEAIQNDLFTIGSELATPPDETIAGFSLITDLRTTELEQAIDVMEAELPKLSNFILPSGSSLAAHLHLARTVVRRAERAVTRLAAQEQVRPEVIQYLNRLSDYLFVLARHANMKAGGKETKWQPR